MTSTGDNDYITVDEFRAAEGTAAWPVLSNGATSFFRTGSLAESAHLVSTIAALPGAEEHAPFIDVRKDGVTVRLLTVSDDWWGMSRRDVDMARRVTTAAATIGLHPKPSVVQSVDPIVIGANDINSIRPFWQALRGYVRRADSPDEDLVDPRGIGPGIWFEAIEGPREGRNRMHVSVWVPPEQAEARVAAAVVAGGRVIFDAYAPRVVDAGRPGGQRGGYRDVAQPRVG